MPDIPHLLPLPESLLRVEGTLADQVSAHQAACEKLAADEAGLERRRAGLPRELADARAGAKELAKARAELVDAELATRRQRIALWEQRTSLCDQAAAALTNQLAELEARRDAARARVAKTFGKAGISPEADPQFPMNPGAARHRFALQVDQAPEVRELLGRLDEISNAQREAPKDSRCAADQAAAAEQRLLAAYRQFVS